MSTNQPEFVWDEEFEEARAKLKEAKRDEEKAREVLMIARSNQNRAEGSRVRATQRAQEARVRGAQARQKGGEARRRGADARLKGLSWQRWESDARQWAAKAQRAAQDVRRWDEEARRKENEAKSAEGVVRERTAHVVERIKVSQNWEQRLKYMIEVGRGSELAFVPDSAVGSSSEVETSLEDEGDADGLMHLDRRTQPEDESLPGKRPKPLEITVGATQLLKDTLDSMEREPHQLLRLVVDSQGTIALHPDAARRNDHVVSHQGFPVLLIDSANAEALMGSMLDVDESSAGRSLVLSR